MSGANHESAPGVSDSTPDILTAAGAVLVAAQHGEPVSADALNAALTILGSISNVDGQPPFTLRKIPSDAVANATEAAEAGPNAISGSEISDEGEQQ